MRNLAESGHLRPNFAQFYKGNRLSFFINRIRIIFSLARRACPILPTDHMGTWRRRDWPGGFAHARRHCRRMSASQARRGSPDAVCGGQATTGRRISRKAACRSRRNFWICLFSWSGQASTARSNLGLGTGALQNTGTSGAVIGLLNSSKTDSGNNTYSGTATFDSTVTVNGELRSAAVSVSTATTPGLRWTGITFSVSRNGNPVFPIQRSGSNGQIMTFWRDTTNVGNISVTGSNTAYNTSSDYRLKKNVKEIEAACVKLAKLRPVAFQWISGGGAWVDGFIAHEVQSIVPDAVTGEKDAMREYGDVVLAERRILEEGGAEPSVIPQGCVWQAADGRTPSRLIALPGYILSSEPEKPVDMPYGTAWVKCGEEIAAQGVDHSKLVPLLTASVQELTRRVSEMETRLALQEQSASSI